MPTPIEHRAVLNLQAAMQAIDATDGYHFSVVKTAVKLNPNHAVDQRNLPDGARPFVLLEIGKAKWEYEPTMQLRKRLPVLVHWISESQPTDDASLVEMFFQGCADVETALAIDVSRGGVASDTRIVGCSLNYQEEGSEVWAQIEVEIWLRRTYGQPNG